MVKRKAEKQQPAGKLSIYALRRQCEAHILIVSPGPLSAVAALAARRAQQKQAQSAEVPKDAPQVIVESGPPSKKPRRSLEGTEAIGTNEEPRGKRTMAAKKPDQPLDVESTPKGPVKVTRIRRSKQQTEVQDNHERVEDEDSEKDQVENAEEMDEDDIASVAGDVDGYESPVETPTELQNFPLSKARLNKSNIVYSDENTLCIRIKERTVCTEIFGNLV